VSTYSPYGKFIAPYLRIGTNNEETQLPRAVDERHQINEGISRRLLASIGKKRTDW